MDHVLSNVCLSLSEGADLRCYVTSNNEACVEIGQADHELTFDYASFRNLVAQANTALAEMEANAAKQAAHAPRRGRSA